LGKGTVVVSSIECTTASLNAVPDSARIYVDRRMTAGETVEDALSGLRALPHLGDARVDVLQYEATSWRGERATQQKFYPTWLLTWLLPEEHALVQGVADAITSVLDKRPGISRWSFSTNGVATMGRHGIPTVGFAPGLEELAHTTDEWVAVDDLVRATAVYSAIPHALVERKDELLAAGQLQERGSR
jgi:putative selenium metabolism hydrolase